MGAINCKKHGRQLIIEVCEHAYEALHSRQKLDLLKIPILNLRVCTSCYDQFRFQAVPDITIEDLLELDDEEADRIGDFVHGKYDQVNRKVMCVACYNELKEKH
ncbi:hypothetical protein POV27_08515 [Aureisphaera galaxeae]|uniref:hypothetical protein n=1 Tax=Aureisphaera galaxeae TaxID=1538023 RepID=UPI00234FE8F7|nr:hypothetical protein [Aureisphaera galaxeae]MDC8004094.1 hypothetical protein [Aureisphaera galaxeae]